MNENNLNRSTSNASEKTLKRKKKRKIPKWPLFILAFIILLFAFVMYCVSSYKSGLEVAKNIIKRRKYINLMVQLKMMGKPLY